MFKNSKKEADEAINARNHVAHGTTLKGSLESQGGLRVDGVVDGEIEAIGKLVIGEKGFVKGQITCKDAEIEGTITGNINASGLLYLKATAHVEGDITVHQMKMDPGAIFIGNNDMKSASQKAPSVNGKTNKSKERVAAKIG